MADLGIGNWQMPNYTFNQPLNGWQGVSYSLPTYNGGMYNFPQMFTFGSSASSSSSSKKYLSVDEYNKQQADAYAKNKAAYCEKKQKEKQQEIANGPTDKEWKILAGEYAKGLSPSESFTGAVAGTAVVAPIFGAGKVKRAVSAGKSGKVFEAAKVAGSDLNKIYSTKRGKKIICEASDALRDLETRATRKWNFLSTCDKRTYVQGKQIMEEAIATGNSKKIAAATEQIKQASVSNGWFARTWRKIRGVPEPNVNALLNDSSTAATAAEKAIGAAKATNSGKLISGLKSAGKGAAVMAALEIIMHIPDMITAFGKDSKTGWKQVGQTSVKAAGNAVGWLAGEAAASAAAGALLGSVAPGIGTAIGFVVGMIGGAIGCWLMGKATHAMVGDDVANQVKAEQMLDEKNNQANPNDEASIQQTGKYQLIQNAVAMHGQGKLSPEAEKILRKYQYVA